MKNTDAMPINMERIFLGMPKYSSYTNRMDNRIIDTKAPKASSWNIFESLYLINIFFILKLF
jgi:hypothetical protein